MRSLLAVSIGVLRSAPNTWPLFSSSGYWRNQVLPYHMCAIFTYYHFFSWFDHEVHPLDCDGAEPPP